MIRWLALAAIVAGCGTSKGKSCTITVASVGLETADGHAQLTGSFDAGEPTMVLTLGGMMHLVTCVVAGATASCDVAGAGVPAGEYDLSFDATCTEPGVDTGTVIDHAAPTFVVN